MIKKLTRFASQLHWYISTPPNTVFTALPSIGRFAYWVFLCKPFRSYVLGRYFSLHFLYPTSSGECGALFAHRYIEYEMYRFITFYLKRGDVMLDVGSNIGCYSLLAASRGAVVHSFEPIEKVLHIERTNVVLNRLEDRVFLHNVVVTDRPGTVKFYLKDNSLISTTIRDPKNPGTEIEVQSTTIDAEVTSEGIDRVAMLKIDVEGAEGKVIAGAMQTIAEGKIDVIYWETNHQAPKKERLATQKALNAAGYKHYAFDVHGRAIRLRPWHYGDANCVSVQKRLVGKVLAFNRA